MAAQVSTHTTLLNRLQTGGDSRAWGEFVHRYGVLVRAVARRYGLQATDADDVLQDVLLGLSKTMAHFDYDPRRARFRTFLRSIVQRVIFRRFRQTRPVDGMERVEGVAADDQAVAIWEAEWRQYHMRRAMETIESEFSARDRKVFTMYVGSQAPASETAKALGLSVDQVYQVKSRIMKRLGELIATQIEEEG